jgi:SnoaL-like domain
LTPFVQPPTDRELIAETLNAYATCIDKGEPEGMARDVFAPDAVVDLGYGAWNGPDEIVRQFAAEIETFDGSAHVLTNLRVKLDGDVASSSVYVSAWHWNKAEGADPARPVDFVTVGVYLDQLRREEAGWRIVHRRFRRLGPSAIALGALPSFIQPEG